MNWYLMLLLSQLGISGLEPDLVYGQPPGELWLQRPHSIAVSPEGQVFISDQDAKRVLVWNRDGSFKGTIGNGGQGPGEFVLPTWMDYRNGRLHVLDPIARRIEVFDPQGQPVKTLSVKDIFTSPMGFQALSDGGYAVVLHAVFDEPPAMKLVLLDAAGHVKATPKRFLDKSFQLENTSRDFLMEITAYSGETTLTRRAGQFLLACGYEPMVYFMDESGAVRDKLELIGRRARMVTAADKNEFMGMEIPWRDGFTPLNKLKDHIRVSFPEHMPYFTGVFPAGSDHILVYERSKSSNHLKAQRYDLRGKPVGPNLELILGWSGTFHISEDQLFAAIYDEGHEEFSLQQFRFNQKKGNTL